MVELARGSLGDILKAAAGPPPQGSQRLDQVIHDPAKDVALKDAGGKLASPPAGSGRGRTPPVKAAICQRLAGRSVVVGGRAFTFDIAGRATGSGVEFDILLSMNGVREERKAEAVPAEVPVEASAPVPPALPPEPAPEPSLAAPSADLGEVPRVEEVAKPEEAPGQDGEGERTLLLALDATPARPRRKVVTQAEKEKVPDGA